MKSSIESSIAAVFSAGALASACGGARAPSPAPAPAAASTAATAPAAPAIRTRIVFGDTFSPRTGDAAVRAFVPDVAADEAGGECMLGRTTGSGATVVTAYYPSRAALRMQVTLTFDSAGRLARYSERRGITHTKIEPSWTNAQRDSAMHAADAAQRTTSVSLDYAIDQGIAMNRGGGKPVDAVLGSVRSVESLEKLGSPIARLERVRKLCGV
jgi:hypothetical protein